MANHLAHRRHNRIGCVCWGTDPASVAAIPDFVAAGCGWMRATRQTQFDTVARGPGKYDWAAGGETSIDRALANGMAVMGILDARFGHEIGLNVLDWCSPIWEHLDAWTDFVRAAVRHYAGRIRCWEVINEPPFFWWHPTPAGERVPERSPQLRRAPIRRYAELLRATAEAIRAEDPDAIIVSGSTFTDGLLLSRLYEEGCRDAFDVVAVHYLNCRHPHDYAQCVRRLRTVMAAHGDGAKPIWDTESGPGGAVIGLSVDTPAAYEGLYNIYRHCFAHEFGVERYFWFNPVSGAEPGAGHSASVRRADGAFTEPYQALRTLVDAIGDGPLVASAHPGGEVHAYVFAGPHGPRTVLWSTAPAIATIPGGAVGHDHRGATVTVGISVTLDGKPLILDGDLLAAGLTANVTGKRETVVPCWANKIPAADTPRLSSPRLAAGVALATVVTREQAVCGAQLTTHMCTVPSAVPGELAIAHDDHALHVRVRTWDDHLDPRRPWGLVQLALRDSDSSVAEWPFFTNAWSLLSLYHGPRGTRCLRFESARPEHEPAGVVAEVVATTRVLADGLEITAAIPWSAFGPCRPGRNNPFLLQCTLSRADGLLDVPDHEQPEEWSHNFMDTFIVRPPSAVRWITFT